MSLKITLRIKFIIHLQSQTNKGIYEGSSQQFRAYITQAKLHKATK